MGEVVDVVDVGPDFRREEFRVERNLFRPRISVQPCEVGERKRLDSLGFRRTAAFLFQWLAVELRRPVRLEVTLGGWRCSGRCARSSHSRS